MRKILPERLEAGRVKQGPMAGKSSWGPYGAFFVYGPCGRDLKIIAAAGEYAETGGWEHVSVSTESRPPNWPEMCFVKDLFWADDECVIQFHPPRSEYVNNHPHCLHLWKPPYEVVLPPSILVGMKNLGELTVEQAIRVYHAVRK